MSAWTDLAALRADGRALAETTRRYVEQFPFCVDEGEGAIGTAPVLTVYNGKGALYAVEVDGGGAGVHLLGEAAQAVDLARRLVRHDLGGLRPDLLPRALHLRIRLVHDPVGQSPLRPLDGASLGLPVALALVSFFLGRPLPPTVAASARLLPGGRLGCVHGIDQKLELLHAWAPRVTTLLVATGQAGAGGRVELRPVEDLAAAIRATWPDLDAQGMAQAVLEGIATADRPRLARRLFTMTVCGTPHVLAWATVRQLAEALGSALEGADAWHARVAAAVAARHAGQTDLPLPSADLGRLPVGLRLELLAQEVQHAADNGKEDWPALAEQALAEACRAEGQAGAAKVLGALGRLYAAWGACDVAEARLAEAWQTWTALYLEAEGGRPLCEWLRVLGARGDADGVETLVAGPVQAVLDHPDTDEVSRAFLTQAAGRALVQVGRTAQGQGWLAPREGEPADTRAGRLRWRARAGGEEGDRAVQVAALPDFLRREVEALLRLDAGEEEALEALDRMEVERLRRWCPEGEALAAHVTRWWRY